MKKARFRPRKKIVKRKPSLSSRSHPWLGPYVGFMHIPFNLKREQMRWSKPREPGLPLWHDNTSRVYFTRYGDVCQKWGVFERTETEELLFESWFRVTELARRVAAGERDAAQSLAMLTDHAVRELEDLATYFPELLKPIARMRPLWPAFISPHPEFKNRNRELLGTLEVGRDTKANVHTNARWRTNNPATKYAIRLIEYVIAMQGQMRELRMLRSLQKKDPTLVVEIPKYPAWVKQCYELPPFNRRNIDQWWAVAKQAFLEGIPHPEREPGLRRLAITPSSRKILYDAEIRSLILMRIKAAMRAMAHR